jgi:hypothetical protein
LEQKVAVPPAVFLVVRLVDESEPSRGDPLDHLLPAGVVVVAGDVAVDDFAGHGGQSASDQRIMRGGGVSVVVLLDREVQVTSSASGFLVELLEKGYGWTAVAARLRFIAVLSSWLAARGLEPES